MSAPAGRRHAPTRRSRWRRLRRLRRRIFSGARLRDAGLLLLAVAVAIGVGYTAVREPSGLAPKGAAAPLAVPPTASPMPDGPLTAWVGDSTLAGDPGVATAVCRAERWSWTFDFQDASGFASAGLASPEPFSTPIYERVAAVAAKHPRLVFLAAGANDAAHQATQAEVRNGAANAVMILRKDLPDTPVVLVGPTWTDGNPPALLLAVRDALKAVSNHFRVPLVDPLGEHWVSGTAPGSDGTAGTGTAGTDFDADGNLTTTGVTNFSALLRADLSRLRVGPAAS